MKRVFVTIFALMIVAGFACNKNTGSATYKVKETPDLLASINGKPIYEKDLDLRAQQKLFDAKKDIIQNYIVTDYMKSKGYKSYEDIINKELKPKVKRPTEAEIKKFYTDRKLTQPYDQIKDKIENFLLQPKLSEENQKFMAGLKSKSNIVYYFARPKADVKINDDDIARGPKDAVVTMVEFTDFQCPFCKKSQDTVKEIEKKYGAKLRHVFKNYPLPMHSEAKDASLSALCANEQGKFWEYHDVLFDKQSELSPEKMMQWAQDLKLNMDQFKKCVNEKKYMSKIDSDNAEGQELGVSSTPTFFINGIMISGARPIGDFSEIIEEELAPKPVQK